MMQEDTNDDAVDAWMQRLAQTPLPDAPCVNSTALWWRAQLERRQDTEHRERRQIERRENVLIALGCAAALVVAAWTWATPTSHPWLVAAATAFAITLAIVAPHAITRIANRR
jgi:hypothetical protein